MKKTEFLSLSFLESKMSIILRFSRFVLLMSVIISFVSLLFIFFSTTKYYYHFGNPSFLDVLQGLIIYAAFYVIIFAAFPATLILIITYFIFKYKFKRNFQVKKHFRLIILNVLILVVMFMIVALNKL